MKRLITLALLALAACGADGEPEPVTEPRSFDGTIRVVGDV